MKWPFRGGKDRSETEENGKIRESTPNPIGFPSGDPCYPVIRALRRVGFLMPHVRRGWLVALVSPRFSPDQCSCVNVTSFSLIEAGLFNNDFKHQIRTNLLFS